MIKDLKRELTNEEKEKPYSKYFYKQLATPNPELMEILKQGPMDPEKALKPEDIKHLLEPGYDEVETGYCILENGAAYVCVNNKFPGVSLDMINWWFAWHALEDLRYMLWFRDGHYGISISDEDREKILSAETPILEKFQGRVHQVIEDTGNGPEDIQISFLSPEQIGFDPKELKEKI